MATFEIPTIATPQKFTTQIGGVSYNFRLTFHDAHVAGGRIGVDTNKGATVDTGDIGGWLLDIATIDNVPMISGIPLVTGADLLAQYVYVGIAGSLTVASDSDPNATPTFEGLGSSGHLYLTTE